MEECSTICFLAQVENHFYFPACSIIFFANCWNCPAVHRYELSELSRKHLESVIHRNRLLHVSFHSFLHGLEHGSGSGISRLFPILYIVLYVPQNGKEQVFYLLYLRFILAQLLSVQKLQVLPCFRPVFRL